MTATASATKGQNGSVSGARQNVASDQVVTVAEILALFQRYWSAPSVMMRTPAIVFASDIVGALGADSLRRLRAVLSHLTEYVPDEPEEERLVRALVEPELEDSGPEGLFKLYYDLGLDELDPLIRQLRMVDHPHHCRVVELGASDHDL